MNARSATVLAALSLGALAALAGCDKPKPRGPAAPAGAAAPAAQPAGPKVTTTTDPVPAPPGWAGALMGKALKAALPQEGACIGNLDVVDTRYQGGSPGTKVIGWGWDTQAKQVVARVVLVDGGMQIVGAGETGLTRPDVPAAKPEVTSQTSGWWAITPLTTGAVDAYGIVKDGQGTCKLGHLEF